MKIQNIFTPKNQINKQNKIKNNTQAFKSNLSPLSSALYTLGNNDMLNASFIDVFAMDTPRTIVEFQNRGKNAGIEMGFREYTGTFIAEFSATVFALLFSKLFSKKNKEINPSSWATNSSIDTFKAIFENSEKSEEGFVKGALASLSGLSGDKINQVPEYSKETVDNLVKLVKGEIKDKKEVKATFENVQDEIINTLKADNNIFVKAKDGEEIKEFSANLSHVLRDIVDLGKNVFFNKDVDYNSAISKLKTLNKSRIAFAIPLSMLLAISNQYINRQLTKKRTGIDNFVGENDYDNNVKNKNENKKERGLIFKKMLSAGVFLAMLGSVMGVKKPSDIINKLEFNGPATGGNAIRTIYGTLILGRIFASKDSTELRETTVRDYLGFLSWLVLGGFVAKGVGQAMDPKKEILFNIQSSGKKGISHWLQDISLKSQKEILAMGGDVKQNLKKLNIAQLSGMAYSAIMLGILLPKLNIYMTKSKKKPNQKSTFPNFQGQNSNSATSISPLKYSMTEFLKQTRKA